MEISKHLNANRLILCWIFIFVSLRLYCGFQKKISFNLCMQQFNMSCVAPEGKNHHMLLVIHSCCHFPCSPPSSKMIQFLVSAAEKSWWIHMHVPRRCLNQHHTINGWESSGALKCDCLYTQLCVNIHKRNGCFYAVFLFRKCWLSGLQNYIMFLFFLHFLGFARHKFLM